MRVERLRVAGWPIAQTALAAGVAWALANLLLGQPQPAFAPIVAVIALGLTLGQRGRRALELIGGVVVGVTIADAIVKLIGTGPLQITLIVALAMAAALLVNGSAILVTEAGVSATLVAILQPPAADSLSSARFLEALVGGAVALVANYVFFPLNPQLIVGRAAQQVLSALAHALERTAAALENGDPDVAVEALTQAREIDEDLARFSEAIATGRETARLAPPRRRAISHLQLYSDAAAQIDLAVRNTRVLARATVRLVRDRQPAPLELAYAVRGLAEAVWSLAGQLEEPDRGYPTRELALRAAARATALLEQRGDLGVSVVVGQIRSTAVDLLRAAGMDGDVALRALDEEPRPEPLTVPVDD